MSKKRFSNDVNIRNKKARYEYEFIDTYVAGLVLKGTEIKSIKEGKASLQEAYCYVGKGEMFIKGMHVSVYEQGTVYNHDPLREKKLLLNKSEIEKIETKSQEKGLTLIPLRLFVNARGYAKIEIALAKGKKIHDKRGSIKEKDVKRELERNNY
ncbi:MULTISPECIES: SsrA-binding protein SmpB [Reichenbachiella]|uniref:SsrA-binding protein n=1 Tax=Reichenbachiella agariperforans TaxID=156994 RepID=A0A1M6LBF5_REIAG|nr:MULTISPECIES: SsrA-binding protein SmpB [Reichenbachiella]MBU2913862.1 SsrA-binding protein SmpB [Reichenbachiella agariperforans]RJE74220.1 SsrA-binding protein [Reichenbachiella sp. MSK19-1]SHJ68550.1 SsrA-binding protein [Reichenbachiella agariperforans]